MCDSEGDVQVLESSVIVHHCCPGADLRCAIIWRWTSSGKYSAKSAYLAQFSGRIESRAACLIWKTWAPSKCKNFTWLLLQNRIWTTNRLQLQQWPNNYLSIVLQKLGNDDIFSRIALSHGTFGTRYPQGWTVITSPWNTTQIKHFLTGGREEQSKMTRTRQKECAPSTCFSVGKSGVKGTEQGACNSTADDQNS